MILTRDSLEVYNAHPCGCYDTETKAGGLYASLCKDWINFSNDKPHGRCWSIPPHVCFKVEAHV